MLHPAFGGARAARRAVASGPGSPSSPAGPVDWLGPAVAERLELEPPPPLDSD